MKNILLIASGILAKHFLERLFLNKNHGLHNFTLVVSSVATLPRNDVNFENFDVKIFDATSFSKLNSLEISEFEKAMIIMDDEVETKEVYSNLRKIEPNLEIDIMDIWGLELENDYFLKLIDARKILSSRFMDFLPDFPIIADNIGLGSGEIMEVRVPVGSSYTYRRVGNIRKKNWSIAMIYRSGKYILANGDSVILPSDNLLIVGEPSILESVFKSIKNESGQFPNPFGSNILVPIDLSKEKKTDIYAIVADARLIHAKLKNKRLIFRICNPNLSDEFEYLKSQSGKNISVIIEYSSNSTEFPKSMLGELDIGLIITTSRHFRAKKKDFFATKIPVLKTARGSFASIKKSVLIGDQEYAKTLANATIDCSKQLGLEIDYYPMGEDCDVKDEFASLSKLFNKSVNIIKQTRNPLLTLRKNSEILHFAEFSLDAVKARIWSVFSMDVQKLGFILNDNYQLFIPKDEERK